MTQVLLGVTDQRIANESDVDWSVSKLGGNPNFTTSGQSPPIPKCSKCCATLALVVQVYCPLDSSEYHRVLYIFACANKQCWNQQESWSVIRCQLLDERSRQGNPSKQVALSTEETDDWGNHGDEHWDNDEEKEAVDMTTKWAVDADDWGDDNEDEDQEQLQQSQNQHSSVSDEDCDPTRQLQQMNIDDFDDEEELDSISRGCTDCQGESETSAANFAPPQSVLTDLLNPASLVSPSDGDSTSSLTMSEQTVTMVRDSTSSQQTSRTIDELCAKQCANSDETTEAAFADNTTESVPEADLKTNRFASYYINVFEEPTSVKLALKHEERLLAEYGLKEGSDLGSTADDLEDVHKKGKKQARKGGGGRKLETMKGAGGESYEKSAPKHGDRTFLKFVKQVSLCPEQILRYSHGGSPCYIKPPQSYIPIPPCTHCGSHRLYELQLMPTLVNYLHAEQEGQELSVEFGTILIFTCSQSCWIDSDLYKVEHVLVQPDPDQHLFRA